MAQKLEDVQERKKSGVRSQSPLRSTLLPNHASGADNMICCESIGTSGDDNQSTQSS